MTIHTDIAAVPDRRARIGDYLAIARFDHATKHVFILPGVVLAGALCRPVLGDATVRALALGLLSAVAIASANYVVNEWLDREFDAYHPEKCRRTAVNKALVPGLVMAEYAGFGLLGLALAAAVGPLFLIIAALFFASGVAYNVKPLRLKDRAYLDVIVESINNPLRLMLGWTMIDPGSLPPSSLLLAYWAGGAFLMAAKRLSEYREIAAGPHLAQLHLYRASFRRYTAEKLTLCCFVYAMMSSSAVAIFLVKYRIEYVLALPLLFALFALYLALSMRAGSVAQKPEKLLGERRLMSLSAANVLALIVLTFVDIPALRQLSTPYIVQIDLGQRSR